MKCHLFQLKFQSSFKATLFENLLDDNKQVGHYCWCSVTACRSQIACLARDHVIKNTFSSGCQASCIIFRRSPNFWSDFYFSVGFLIYQQKAFVGPRPEKKTLPIELQQQNNKKIMLKSNTHSLLKSNHFNGMTLKF